MHIKTLQVFCEVVRRRSFSQAAKTHGLTQSAVSQMVSQLERALGARLIDRSKRPFVLTPEGETCLAGCRDVLRRWQSLEESIRVMHDEFSGRVQVASIYSVGLSHMSELLQQFLVEYPKANVRLEYQHPARVYRMVEDERVDLGLVSYPVASRSIEVTLWRQETMVVVTAPEHELAAAGQISLRDVDGLPMVGFDEDLRIRQEIDKQLKARGIRTRVAMAFDNIETLKRAVEINAGISLLPWPTVAREVAGGTLAALPVHDAELLRPLGIIRRKGKPLGATAERFIEFLQKHDQVDCPSLERVTQISMGSGI